MNVIGIDPASKSLAVFFSSGVIKRAEILPASLTSKSRGDDIASIRVSLNFLLTEYTRDYGALTVFIEEPVVAGVRNLRSTILIAETVGAALSVQFPTYLVPVSSWKKATVGKGIATKEQCSDWLTREHPSYAALCGGSQDLIDAACICLYGQGVIEGVASRR